LENQESDILDVCMEADSSTMIFVGPHVTRFVTFGDNELSELYQQKLTKV